MEQDARRLFLRCALSCFLLVAGSSFGSLCWDVQRDGGALRADAAAVLCWLLCPAGDPPVVFLDEPSTGLDPASRQQLWGVVREAKKDRAMVLTTHSMQEAEELCDRIGIFVAGALRCVGNPKELTARFGGFLVLSLTTTTTAAAAAAAAGGGAASGEGAVWEWVRRELSPRAVRTHSAVCRPER